MNVLLLEDRGSVAHYMAEALCLEGHQVFRASSIPDAKTLWSDHDIDCLIVDLNMRPIGLRAREIEETRGSVLTGWVWLKNYVFPEDATAKRRTIIYTEYLREFRQSVKADQLEGMHLVSKQGSTSPSEEVMECVRRIAHEVEAGTHG